MTKYIKNVAWYVAILLSLNLGLAFAENNENIVLGKEATASSYYNNLQKYSADMVGDGDVKTGWLTGFATPISWVQVDLGGYFLIDEVEVFAFASQYNYQEARKNFMVLLSNDSNFVNYEVVGKRGSVPYKHEGSLKFTAKFETPYRYVRISKTKDGTNEDFSIGEIAVYGDKVEEYSPQPTIKSEINEENVGSFDILDYKLSKTVVFVIDHGYYAENGKISVLRSPPILHNDSTFISFGDIKDIFKITDMGVTNINGFDYVLARDVATAMGLEIFWEDNMISFSAEKVFNKEIDKFVVADIKNILKGGKRND